MTPGAGREDPRSSRPRSPVPADASGRYFFLSCERVPATAAEADTESAASVARFFDDLCDEVRSHARARPLPEPGSCDLHARRGDGWPERVEGDVATCRVLVPLYSSRYFASEECGRELSAFLRRASGRVAPIVAAVWAPTAGYWPRVPAPHRLIDPVVDDRYGADGLYGLMHLRDTDGEAERCYRAVVAGLGAQIATLAERAPLPAMAVRLAEEPNVFTQGRPGLGLHVLAPTRTRCPPGRDPGRYAATSPAWNPFGDDEPGDLEGRMVRLARNLGYEPRLTSFDEAVKEILGVDPPPGPAVLVIDPWALDDPAWSARLGELDGIDRPWVGVVVAWNPHDPQTRESGARLTARLDEVMPRRWASRPVGLQMDAPVAASVDELMRVLSVVVKESAVQYLRRASGPAPGGRAIGWPEGVGGRAGGGSEAADGA